MDSIRTNALAITRRSVYLYHWISEFPFEESRLPVYSANSSSSAFASFRSAVSKLSANQRFEQALFGKAPAARCASVIGAATQMLGDRVLLLGCEFAVGVHREVLGYVVLAVHGSLCLYTQARLI